MHRLRGMYDAFRANFFVLPAAAVVLAFGFARVAVGIDAGPWVGDATIDSARAVLSTVAAATITFASITFSVSLLIIQQGSSQFSPRVVHGLTRDPFNRRVIAFVLATFTYCLVVLQRVRAPLEEGSDDVVPRFAAALGLVLGIAAVLAVIGVIHHTSRQMDVSHILGRIADEAVRTPLTSVPDQLRPIDPFPAPESTPSTVVSFAGDGWIRQIDRAALMSLAASGGVVRLETDTGRYAIRSTPICTIWPPVAPDDLERVTATAHGAVQIGPTRTMSEDSGYGVRQLVDVALRALSPGINDPTTAHDAILHLGTVLVARLSNPAIPTAYAGDDGRRLLTPHATTDAELARLAFTELRRAAGDDPTVYVYLLEMLGDVIDAGRWGGAGDRLAPFLHEARLLQVAADDAAMLDDDRERVRRACARALRR